MGTAVHGAITNKRLWGHVDWDPDGKTSGNGERGSWNDR
jgi:hypothetical protein